MARAPRVVIAGDIYHVTSRGNRRQAIFTCDADHERFLELLGDVVTRHGWRCHAYCLLTNHYHVLVETPKADLSAGMHRLNGSYAQWFNLVHGLDGHLFQRRFHSVLVQSAHHLFELSRYIALNPVRANACLAPLDWRWSSYSAVAGYEPAPQFLVTDAIVGQFGPTLERARAAWRGYVEEGLARGRWAA